jgi:hypothetical protein
LVILERFGNPQATVCDSGKYENLSSANNVSHWVVVLCVRWGGGGMLIALLVNRCLNFNRVLLH